MQVTAIIAARGGSVRLPGKAMLPYAGTTMIGHKIDTLKACRLVSRIVVNTDSPNIRAEAIAHGAELIDGRDYHDDTREMIGDSVAKVNAADNDLILWAHPTNPLVSAQTYRIAIEMFQFTATRAVFDSLCSVYAVKRHAWMGGQPINYNPWAERHQLAADLPPICFQDGAIFIQPAGQMLANRYFFGANPLLFVMPENEVSDIDTAADYQRAISLL